MIKSVSVSQTINEYKKILTPDQFETGLFNLCLDDISARRTILCSGLIHPDNPLTYGYNKIPSITHKKQVNYSLIPYLKPYIRSHNIKAILKGF